jgi:hypothetical protein
VTTAAAYILFAAVYVGPTPDRVETWQVKTFESVDACTEVQINNEDRTIKPEVRALAADQNKKVVGWLCVRDDAGRTPQRSG